MIKINNWINGEERKPCDNKWINKINPHTGQADSMFADSKKEDIEVAVSCAKDSFPSWSNLTPVERGSLLFGFVQEMKNSSAQLADCVSKETGKSFKDASGEVQGAIAQGEFFAGEGRRLYSRSLTSGTPGKYSHTVRCPLGVAGLIVPANTPIANIAWKIFPALICGNTVVLKASEDSPEIAMLIARISKDAGLPDGVLNIVQGDGNSAGSPLVESEDVDVISFTGSTSVGKIIASKVGARMGRVSLELGGKNPLVICSDADMENAINWCSLSAFSNAGQRCASGSKLIIFEDIYDEFKEKMIKKSLSLKLGIDNSSDLGPVMNKKQFLNIMSSIENAEKQGGIVLCGGNKSSQPGLADGFYIEPTLIEGLDENSDLSCNEIFGPVASLHKVKNLNEAINLSNSTQYGLTAAIHTKDVDSAILFAHSVRAGVVNVNAGTYGSEPHMPFGGFGISGNGTREPGVEALDVYSEIKNISMILNAR